MKKFNIVAAAAAGLFAVATAIIGDINQQKAIDEAVERRMNQETDEDDETEEES